MTSFVTSLGQPGFESPYDFDSFQPGEQNLFNSMWSGGTSIVNVTSATSNATFTESRIGSFDAGSINLPGGSVSLNTLGGTISDSEGSITAANLHLSGGSVQLDNANNVTNLVANIEGALFFNITALTR